VLCIMRARSTMPDIITYARASIEARVARRGKRKREEKEEHRVTE